MAVEDKLKEAAKHFFVATTLFEKIKIENSNLKPPDMSLDMTEQNLLMCSYIMKAQAQYCAYEKVKRTTQGKYNLLSGLAKQASVYYGKAYSFAATPPVSKAVNQKIFVSVLHFNEYAFMAHAHYWVALQYQKETEEKAKGIGVSIAHIQKALEYLDEIKKHEKTLSPQILVQYRDMYKHYSDKKAFLEDQNNKIYHEIPPKNLDEIECLQFGQPISIEDDLTQSFEGKEIFSRMVPPAVRKLEEEYKLEVGAIINKSTQEKVLSDMQQEEFLKKYDLPSSLHAASGEQTLPEDLWARIRQCKEKGGMRGIRHTIEGMTSMCESAESSLINLGKQLQIEEEEDEAMKVAYTNLWTRTPSKNLNQGMRNQLQYYVKKLEQCKNADATIERNLEEKEDYLDLIELDKEEIIGRIPKSSHAERKQSFVAAK